MTASPHPAHWRSLRLRRAARPLAAAALLAAGLAKPARLRRSRLQRRIAVYAAVIGYDLPASVVGPACGLSARQARACMAEIEDRRERCAATEAELQRLSRLLGVTL